MEHNTSAASVEQKRFEISLSDAVVPSPNIGTDALNNMDTNQSQYKELILQPCAKTEITAKAVKPKKSTREAEVQTPVDERIKEKDDIITALCLKIRILEDKIQKATLSTSSSDYSPVKNDCSTSLNNTRDVSTLEPIDDTDEEGSDTTDGQDMEDDNDTNLVPIGEGYARVPAKLLKNLNWKSPTQVTRKLLIALFPRRILATHSLTGKPSPAFPDKPPKNKLDPRIVNDIIMTVTSRCNAKECSVRTSITTKLADETKMYRARQMKKKPYRGGSRKAKT